MLFQCHSCGFQTEAPDRYAGKSVKCLKCKTPVTIEAQGTPPPANHGYSVSEFLKKTRFSQKQGHGFELEKDRLLQVKLNGRVWTKLGAMVAYEGEMTFTREGIFEHGVGKMFKKAATGEGAQLMKAEGMGYLYLADNGKKISILHLKGESIFVNGNDLLAFEDGIEWDIKLMKKLTAMLAGGLFNVKLTGTGMVALTTHHDPVSFKVTAHHPVFTDPNATVAWSGGLVPELKTDVSFKTFIGRGSGESFQMKFQGNGFVVIQPFEEATFQAG